MGKIIPATGGLPVNQQEYLRFCDNPLHGRAKLLRDFHELRSNTDLIGFGLANDTTMMIQTEEVYISHMTDTYRIGMFMIFIKREVMPNKYVEVDLWFENLNNTLYRDDENLGAVLHPHISEDTESFNSREIHQDQIPYARPCWPQGEAHVMQLIMRAEIPYAVENIIKFLHSYNEGSVYKEIDTWKESNS